MYEVEGHDEDNVIIYHPSNGLNLGICEVFEGMGANKDKVPLIKATPKLLRCVSKLLSQIDSEIEQRQHGGNGEDWADLKALSDEAHAVVREAAGGAS
jgi:hypothetical protein